MTSAAFLAWYLGANSKSVHAYTREELIELCEAAIVPAKRWVCRYASPRHEQLGTAWALLKAGFDFTVCTLDGDDKMLCVTILYPSFQSLEWDRRHDKECMAFFPTKEGLLEWKGEDWT